MATPTETTDEFTDLLTCSICLEVFRNPKYLPCLHTFCEVCINTYISSSLHENSKGINCPVCRKFVSLKGTSDNQETWADELPTNFLIGSMISLHKLKTTEKLCDCCLLREVRKRAFLWCSVCAEAYCDDCVKDHKKFKLSRNHKTIPLTESLSGKYNIEEPGYLACDEHKDRVIDVYCVDHCKPCCTLCATVLHRKCENVITIDKAVQGIKYSSKTEDFLDWLKYSLEQLDISLRRKQENISTIKQETKDIRDHVDMLIDNVARHMAMVKKSFHKRLTVQTKVILAQLNREKDGILSLSSTFETLFKTINKCIHYGSDIECLIEIDRLVSKKEEIGKRVEEAVLDKRTKSVVLMSCDVFSNFQKLKTLGKLTTVRREQFPSVNMRSGSIQLLFTITIGVYKSGCNWGSGIFIQDMIILTDYQNCNVLVYSNEGEFISQLKLPNRPTDITKVNENTVSVSCKRNRTIHVINIKEMKLIKTVVTRAPVSGLVYIDNKYIVGDYSVLSWIDASSGRKTEEVKTNGDTYYLYACGRKDYVCANGPKEVSCLSNGRTKFTYTSKDFSGPRGIDSDFQGNIYICAYLSNNIHQITSEGKLVRIIQSSTLGIHEPWVIRFETNSNRFLLTSVISGNVAICEIY